MSGLKIRSADEAETVFYEAFNYGDSDMIAELWATKDIVCVHPGSGVISEYAAVVRSWQHILQSSQTSIRHTPISKTITDQLAVHVVAEEIMEDNEVVAVVIATNVYKRIETSWRMIEHHGSLVQNQRDNVTLQ